MAARKSGTAEKKNRPEDEKYEVTLEDAIALAHGHHQSGNFILAERTYRDILRAVPGHYPTIQYLGVLLFQTGNPQEAREYLAAAVEENPGDKNGWNNYGVVLTQLKEYDGALAAYDRALSLDPDYIEALNNKSHTLWQLKRYPEAEEASRAALEKNPESVIALNNLGITLARRVKYEESLDIWEKAVKLKPQDATLWANWGNSLREMGRLRDSEEKCRRAADLDPKNPEALNNLANALRDLGKVDEAIALYRRATDERPDFYNAHYNLSIALADNGLFEEAAVAARYAVAFNNEFAEGYSALSSAYCELGDYVRAHAAAQRAIHIAPDDIIAYLSLANILMHTDKLDDSDAAIQEALRREPDSPRAYMKLAELREQMNEPEKALAAIDRALEMSPDMPALWARKASIYFMDSNIEDALKAVDQAIFLGPQWISPLLHKAEILTSTGRDEEAVEVVRKAMALNDKAPGPYFTLSGLKKYASEEDEDFRKMKALEDKVPAYGMESVASYNFAMADAYESMKKYDLAFEHMKRANDIRRKTVIYPVQKAIDAHNALRLKYTAPYFEKTKGTGFKSDIPVFIIGMPRSGTTLTEQILAAHPMVYGAGELADLNKVYKMMASGEKTDFEDMGREYVRRAKAHDRQGKGIRITDKMPANYIYVGFIENILPDAKIIHCRRNAMDTCLSCYKQNFARGQYWSYSFEEMADEYKRYLAMMAHWREVLPGRMLEIDYEDTVNDLETQARRLVDYIGLPWDDACLAPHKKKRAVLTASRAQVSKPLYKTSVEKWRIYEKHLEPLAQLLGEKA